MTMIGVPNSTLSVPCVALLPVVAPLQISQFPANNADEVSSDENAWALLDPDWSVTAQDGVDSDE